MILIALATALLVPAAIAWACNPQAHLSLNSSSYGPGDTITVTGSYFSNGDNISVSTTGSSDSKVVSGGGFVAQLTAPSSAGSYTVTASRTDGYRAGLPKTASFEVVEPTSPNAPSSGGSSSFRQPRTPHVQPRTPHVAGVGGGGGTVQDQSGQPVFAGSVAPSSSGGGAFFGGTASAAGATRPSEQSAVSDVWSGFAPGKAASLTSAAGMPDGGAGSQLSLGIVLLALGLLALVGGLTTAEVMRRRAPGA
ncbi:MAG: hypothetical protein ACRDK5_10955 [Solirubrobacterales bacterium]